MSASILYCLHTYFASNYTILTIFTAFGSLKVLLLLFHPRKLGDSLMGGVNWWLAIRFEASVGRFSDEDTHCIQYETKTFTLQRQGQLGYNN